MIFERPFLASILMQPELIYDVKLKPFHFKSLENRNIYEAMLSLADQKVGIDSITLKAELDKMKVDISAANIMDLMQLMPSGANIWAYQKNIIEEHKKTELYQLAGMLTDVQDVNDTIVKLSNRLNEIGSDDDSVVDQKTLAVNYMESLEKPHVTISTGFYNLDKLLGGGLPYGELVIIGARPSVGKTAFAVCLAVNIMQNMHVLFFSLEMGYNQIANRIMSIVADIDSYAIRYRNETAIVKVVNHLSQLNKIVIDDTPALALPDMRMRIKTHIRERGIKLVVIDYIGLMTAHTEAKKHEQISAITKGLKNIAKEFNICIIALSQLSRLITQRTDPRPILSDLRDSGAIEEDAHTVMFIHRDIMEDNDEDQKRKKDPTKAEIIVGKDREGRVGIIKFDYRPQFTKFVEQITF